MIIPDYWAEARRVGKVGKRRRVVRRFGWSNDSEADAQQLAEQRAAAALQAMQQGERLPARERRVAYSGSEGLPIREEVVARNGEDAVTRNAYGARCLNVPDVLFADLDLEPQPPRWVAAVTRWGGRLLFLAGFAAALWAFWRGAAGGGCFLLVAAVFLPLPLLRWRRARAFAPGNFERCRQELRAKVRAFAAADRGRRLALYDTPLGLRVLALHATFDPRGAPAKLLFQELGADPRYVRMCTVQACFRARVSGKPWRMGIAVHVRPGRSAWPVRAEVKPVRDAWIARYEAVAKDYCACRFVEELGSGAVHPRAAAVRRMHDAMCQANSQLPMA